MKTFAYAVLATALGFVAAPAGAVPELQLYIEGATYDAASETWVSEGSDTVRLWAIGNVGGPGSKGPIYDVKLAIAYDSVLNPTFALTSSTTAGYGGYDDPSTPGGASFSQTKTDGSAPLMGDGGSLPSHGIYGPGTSWTEFLLGDFTLEDSQIADFSVSFPDAAGTPAGQINVYEIVMSGVAEETSFHFDLYDHYIAKKGTLHYIKAPFSHDAGSGPGGGGPPSGVPEPGSLALIGAGLLGMGALRRRRRD